MYCLLTTRLPPLVLPLAIRRAHRTLPGTKTLPGTSSEKRHVTEPSVTSSDASSSPAVRDGMGREGEGESAEGEGEG